MKKFLENISKYKVEIKKTLIILVILLTIAGVYLYNASFYIIIRFDQLGPLAKNMTAYYNGFKIGKIVSIEPDNDFKHTLVKVKLSHKEINLPQNTTVTVERFPNGVLYVQFIYPSSPSFKTLKRGDIIEGIAPYSLEQFMLGQNISGVTDVVSLHVIKALNATEVANIEMTTFFQNTSKLISENRKGITASVNNTATMTKNLAQMAENLNQASKKLNDAIDTTTLKDSTSNIKQTTSNLKNTTDDIAKVTKDIDKTMKKVDDTVSETKAAAENLNSMTEGLNETLSKRFAGMRIIFGTPVKQKKCRRKPHE